jgi:hypothetical protein
LTSAWSTSYPGYIPVGFSEQGKVEAPKGFKLKIVPDWVANAVRGAKSFVVKHTGSPMDRLKDWYKNNNWEVNAKAQKDLSDIIRDLDNERTATSKG